MDCKQNPSFSLEGPGDNAGERHTEYIATAVTTPLTKLKPNRRWLQFSMRTVLVLVTLLCMALAVWVVPAERQRRAVAAIGKLGGVVDYKKPAASETFPVALLRRWLPPDYFGEVESLYLSNTGVTDAELTHLERLPGLRYLNLYYSGVTDAGLVHLERLTRLERLSLTNAQVTDAGLAHLHGLTSLRWLYLNNTRVTDEGLARLRRALPNCRIEGP